MRNRGGNEPLRRAFPLAAILGLLVLSSFAVLASGAPAAAPSAPLGLHKILTLSDQSTIHTLVGLTRILLSDVVTALPGMASAPSYTIGIHATVAVRSIKVHLQTQPTNFWSHPGQMPYGADNLPPISQWTWWVHTSTGKNDTANWSVDPTGVFLLRTISWVNQGYTVFALSHPRVAVSVNTSAHDGTNVTGGGFVLNMAGATYSVPLVSGYPAMAASLRPSLIRFSLTTTGTFYGWNNATKQPVLSFVGIDRDLNLTHAAGGQVMLSLPVGNWGDGNVAPNGTPYDSRVLVTFHAMKGYFLAQSVIYALVRQIANHTYANNETIDYWSIGNEVPLNSSAEAIAYSKEINTAITAIHVLYPTARVGTDDMSSTTYLSVFAKHTPNVGFLSFHYYQSWGMCVNSTGSYCAPKGQPNGTPLPTIFAHPAYYHSAGVYSPAAAQSLWHNLTGRWIPIMNTETNIAAYGGTGSSTQTVGTDPRIPDLMGASWLGSLLVDSSRQNVSALTYFTLTSNTNVSKTITWPRGGFGYGLTNVTPSGKLTYFAPYYVMQLWDQYLPQGSGGLLLNSSDSTSVRTYAVSVGGQVNVAVVSRVGVPIAVDLQLSGHYILRNLTVLDSNSYEEQYNATTDTTTVVKSGVSAVANLMTDEVDLNGYGFAIAQFVPSGIFWGGSPTSGGSGIVNGPGAVRTGQVTPSGGFAPGGTVVVPPGATAPSPSGSGASEYSGGGPSSSGTAAAIVSPSPVGAPERRRAPSSGRS